MKAWNLSNGRHIMDWRLADTIFSPQFSFAKRRCVIPNVTDVTGPNIYQHDSVKTLCFLIYLLWSMTSVKLSWVNKLSCLVKYRIDSWIKVVTKQLKDTQCHGGGFYHICTFPCALDFDRQVRSSGVSIHTVLVSTLSTCISWQTQNLAINERKSSCLKQDVRVY